MQFFQRNRLVCCLVASAALVLSACEEESDSGSDADATDTSSTDTATSDTSESDTAAESDSVSSDTSDDDTSNADTAEADTSSPADTSEPAYGDQDCPEVNECTIACPSLDDTACIDACVADGTEAAQRDWPALLQCADDNGCLELTGADQSNCITGNCADEVDACLVHFRDCPSIVRCAKDCTFVDTYCESECASEGTEEARAQYDAVGACSAEYQCPDANYEVESACMNDNCSDQLAVCEWTW